MSTPEASHARWETRRAVERLLTTQTGPQRPLDALRALRHAQDSLARATNLTVDAARVEGATWVQIGTALDITRQAARQGQLRRLQLEQARAEAKQWHLPLPWQRARFRWLTRKAS